MFGVRSCCFGILLLIGEALAEDRVIIDTIEDFNNSTGVENFDVDTMTMEDKAFNKVKSSITNDITDDIDIPDNDENTTMLVEEMCGNSSLLEHMMNVTKDRGIVHGFSK